MEKPHLTQFGELLPAHFQKHPVWINCHVVDSDQPWYAETDEETFRPWDGVLPASPSEGMLLVRATATLRDGSRLPAFITPGFEGDGLGTLQPQLFVGERRFAFWGGVVGHSSEEKTALYAGVGKGPEDVFPIAFIADGGLTTGVGSIEVRGFYRTKGFFRSKTVVEV